MQGDINLDKGGEGSHLERKVTVIMWNWYTFVVVPSMKMSASAWTSTVAEPQFWIEDQRTISSSGTVDKWDKWERLLSSYNNFKTYVKKWLLGNNFLGRLKFYLTNVLISEIVCELKRKFLAMPFLLYSPPLLADSSTEGACVAWICSERFWLGYFSASAGKMSPTQMPRSANDACENNGCKSGFLRESTNLSGAPKYCIDCLVSGVVAWNLVPVRVKIE